MARYRADGLLNVEAELLIRQDQSGGYRYMEQREIIFFDELGFGWVVDAKVIDLIHESNPDNECIIEKALSDLLYPS